MQMKIEAKHPYRDRRRRSIVRDFFRLTSIHGLPAIARAYGPKNVVCWSIIFLLFFAVMLYFVTMSVLVFFTYPTQTNVDIVVEYPMLFPAVTVCNYQTTRYDLTLGPFMVFAKSIGLIPANSSTPPDLSNPILLGAMEMFIIELINGNTNIADFVFVLKELLFSCTYNGLSCNASDFVPFTSSKYGLCYTFNAQTDGTNGSRSARTTTYNGGQGVLQLEFFVYDFLNIPFLGDGIGIVALLHDNQQVPQIDIDGIGFAPNRKHTLQFSKETTSFLGAPYTNCTTTIRADMKTMYDTYYSGKFTEYQYSRQLCMSLCEQAYVYSVCGCTSPLFLNTRYVLLPNGTVILAPLCPFTSTCYAAAANTFLNSLSIIGQQCSHCTSECRLTSYNVQLSSILAPSIFTQMVMKQWLENNSLINSSRTINLPADWSGNFSTYIKQNYVGLQIALGTNLVNSYTQSATLSWTDLRSNVGAQTGLWIGVSMLSLIELLEMFYRLIRLHFSRMKSKTNAFQ